MSHQTSFRLYTSVAPKPAAAKAALSVAAGKRQVFKIPVPAEGRLHRLTVFQESGTNVAFAVELVASTAPYGAETDAAANYNAAVSAPAAPYRVIAQQTALSGATVDWRAQDSAGGAEGVPYVNMDQASRTEARPYLYLVVIPTAAGGTTTWCATLVLDQTTSF